MEELTFTAIDYNSLENRVIEDRVRGYYKEVKWVFEKVLENKIKNPNSPVGLCADLILVGRISNRTIPNLDIELWRQVIKPWFTPQRFNLEYLYFGYDTPFLVRVSEETLDINGRIWLKVPIERLKGYEYLFHTAFWFPVSKEHNPMRIKILECALEDLERIYKEGEPKLPPITEDEPIIY